MIGIKIADGSFYPILEEGVPGEKKLVVTTARDKQTTVQINLYRSESGNMDDADYVDTLLIDNLKPHQKEEPSFNLIVKIDENNMLSAEIDDPETGEKSDTKVSLVNMGNKSIFDDTDFTVSAEEEPATYTPVEDTPEAEDDEISENSDEVELESNLDEEDFSLSDTLSDIPDLDDEQIKTEKNDDFSFSDEEDSDEQLYGGFPPDIASIIYDDFSFSEKAEKIKAEKEEPIPEPSESASDDFALPDFDSLDEPEETPIASDDFSVQDDLGTETLNDDFSFTEEQTDQSPSIDDISENNDDFSFSDEAATDEQLSEEVPDDIASIIDDDFSFSDQAEEIKAEKEEVVAEPIAEAVLSDDDFSFSTDFLDDENEADDDEKPFSFDSLPDFDEIPELADSSEKSEFATDDLDIDFTIPEENDMKRKNYNDTYDDYSDQQSNYEYASSGGMQNALFGGDDLFEETKKRKERRNIVPVIICILCALISLGVLGIILYLTPSIMKIAGGKQAENTAVIESVESGAEKQIIEAEEEIIIPEPTIRKTEENKIVVLNETVPPVVPETKKEQKEISNIIRHLVKWGDTLWDLAGFYYRNPWLYKIISDANNLKNPDLIISGTYLTIPDHE
ncbi:MAG: LysM peptidoglycan-binding domain-containing protein [Treponemataceae bacterium]|nr:LysM peptidoglycan-binding domain-containing protein [Treponemataceae bacterium]